MKKRRLVIGLAGGILLLAGAAFSGQGTVEQGEMLFNDPALGESANEKSCATCHPDGKGLEKAGSKTNLPHIINLCIERALEGTAFEEDSVEIDSLKRYIKSFR